MTRPLGTLLLLSLVSTPLSAQGHLGFVAGGVSSTLSTGNAEQVPNKTSRTGLVAGITTRFAVGERLAFTPEVLYVQKGATAHDDTHTITEHVKIDYVEVPLLLRLALGSGTTQPYLIGGGSVAFRASCNLRFVGIGQEIKEDCTANNSEVTSTDVGAIIGAGVTKGRLGVSVRYELGLRNINKESTGNDAVKNRAVMGMVSISW